MYRPARGVDKAQDQTAGGAGGVEGVGEGEGVPESVRGQA